MYYKSKTTYGYFKKIVDVDGYFLFCDSAEVASRWLTRILLLLFISYTYKELLCATQQ